MYYIKMWDKYSNKKYVVFVSWVTTIMYSIYSSIKQKCVVFIESNTVIMWKPTEKGINTINVVS